jgi:hypothetical protein
LERKERALEDRVDRLNQRIERTNALEESLKKERDQQYETVKIGVK